MQRNHPNSENYIENGAPTRVRKIIVKVPSIVISSKINNEQVTTTYSFARRNPSPPLCVSPLAAALCVSLVGKSFFRHHQVSICPEKKPPINPPSLPFGKANRSYVNGSNTVRFIVRSKGDRNLIKNRWIHFAKAFPGQVQPSIGGIYSVVQEDRFGLFALTFHCSGTLAAIVHTSALCAAGDLAL